MPYVPIRLSGSYSLARAPKIIGMSPLTICQWPRTVCSFTPCIYSFLNYRAPNHGTCFSFSCKTCLYRLLGKGHLVSFYRIGVYERVLLWLFYGLSCNLLYMLDYTFRPRHFCHFLQWENQILGPAIDRRCLGLPAVVILLRIEPEQDAILEYNR